MTPDTITIDQNHELAGKDLIFTITLARIVKT
jgi:FKBP-type peptidyl-prolyl cis-trans isomerase 2